MKYRNSSHKMLFTETLNFFRYLLLLKGLHVNSNKKHYYLYHGERMMSAHMCSNTAVLPSPVRTIWAGIWLLASMGVQMLTQISLVSCYVGAVWAFVLASRPLHHSHRKARLRCVLPGRETTHLALHVHTTNATSCF